jgi:hypothetical protein
MYAALRAIPVSDDVVARLFHAASLLREHRVLYAVDMGTPAENFDLAAKPYESLEPGELDELKATLELLTTRLLAQDQDDCPGCRQRLRPR